jgi:alanyl-tRNA synthetase
LRKVLAKDVMQKGSYVDDKRVRFDFSFPRALTPTELAEIEHAMNTQIQSGLEVEKKEMTYDEAMNYGALGLFTEKYGDTVRVIDIGDGYSVELCGGTHLDSLTEMGSVKILKESSIASGVRRIEVLCGVNSYEYYREQDQRLDEVATLLKTTPEQVQEKVGQLLSTIKDLEQRIGAMEHQEVVMHADALCAHASEEGILIAQSTLEARHFRTLATLLTEKKGLRTVFITHPEGQFVLATDGSVDARELLKKLAAVTPQLSGGGSPRLVQGKGCTPEILALLTPAHLLS